MIPFGTINKNAQRSTNHKASHKKFQWGTNTLSAVGLEIIDITSWLDICLYFAHKLKLYRRLGLKAMD